MIARYLVLFAGICLTVGGCSEIPVDPVEGGSDPTVAYLAKLEAQGAIPSADVNRDGVVGIQDLVLVARDFGQQLEAPQADIEVRDLEMKRIGNDVIGPRWSYKLTLVNNTDRAFAQVSVGLYLIDAEGLPIDQGGLIETLQPSESKAIVGVAGFWNAPDDAEPATYDWRVLFAF